MATTRENLSEFNGRENVTKVIGENGNIGYLTQSVPFISGARSLGASKVNTFENEKKHVLFLFDASDKEVGRFYLGQKLQGKSAAEIAEMKHSLLMFESYNAEKAAWVPTIGLSTQEDLSASAVEF